MLIIPALRKSEEKLQKKEKKTRIKQSDRDYRSILNKLG